MWRRRRTRRGLASVYIRGSVAFVQRSDQTVDGFWVSAGDVLTVSAHDIEALALVVESALGRSRDGVPNPPRNVGLELTKPLQEAAGVRSWKAFQHGAQQVSVRNDGDTTVVQRYRAEGRGYLPTGDRFEARGDRSLADALREAID